MQTMRRQHQYLCNGSSRTGS